MSSPDTTGPLTRIRSGLPARILESLSAVIIIVDDKRRIVRFNPAAERMTGVLASEALGKQFVDVHPAFEAIESSHALDRVFQLGATAEARDIEIEVRGFNYLRHFDFTLDPLINDDSRIAGAAIMAFDVTELARLRSRMARQNEDMVVLHRISNVLRSTNDVNKALFIICTALTSVGSARNDHAIVFLDEEKSGVLRGAMAAVKYDGREIWRIWHELLDPKRSLEGVLEAEFPGVARRTRRLTAIARKILVPRADERLVIAEAVRQRRVITQRDLPDSGLQLHPRLKRFFGMKSFAVMPLVVDNEGIGALVANSTAKPRRFGSESLKMLEMFADQAALAINNTLLFRRIAENARRDSLTGLYNHGYFQERLADELGRARRYNDSVALLMLDIDYFKKLNDTYGHQTGDSVLVNLSGLLNATVRTTDACARYGGEEFAIILPRTSREDALKFSERLRQRIEAATLGTKDGVRVPVTISGGLAVFPEDGGDPVVLVAAADRALYAAKRAGRNRIVNAAADA